MRPSYKLLAPSIAALLTGTAFAAGSLDVEHEPQAVLDALAACGGQPLETRSPAAARGVLVSARRGAHAKLAPADATDKIVVLDGQPLRHAIVHPAGARGVLPAFMFFHDVGGGPGDYPTHERFARDLVADSGAAAVLVNYTRSPEVRYPAAINQACAATKRFAENGASIGVDDKHLAVAGNMPACRRADGQAHGTPALRGEVLSWAVTSVRFADPSYGELESGHFLTRPLLKRFRDV